MANIQQQYGPIIAHAAQANGIPVQLLTRQIGAESNFNPHARSPVGALGMMQLMPGTASGLGVTDPFDPVQNIMAGAKYLREQYDKFGSWDKALAAYNAGPGAVAKYGGIPPFAETQNYVRKIMGGLPAVGAAPQASSPSSVGGLGLGGSAPADFLRQKILQETIPTASTVSMLQPLGGTAAKIASMEQGEAKPPPLKPPPVSFPSNPPANLPPPLLPATGLHGILNGRVPMITGNTMHSPFSNLRIAGHVDWSHVNPRLLNLVNNEAKKMGVVVDMISGYRSNLYSAAHGGFAGDPHTKGLAGDFYINGHPIGEVIPADQWSKMGITSGATPGFYKGKSDPEHLQLTGIPIKGGPSA